MALPTYDIMHSQSGSNSLLHMHSLTEPDCFYPGSHKRRQGGDAKVWCNGTIDPTRLVPTPTHCNLLLQRLQALISTSLVPRLLSTSFLYPRSGTGIKIKWQSWVWERDYMSAGCSLWFNTRLACIQYTGITISRIIVNPVEATQSLTIGTLSMISP